MTASVISSAVAAIVAALSAGTPVAPVVQRVRMRPVQSVPAVVVRPIDAEPGEAPLYSGAPIWWMARIAIECYAKADPDQAADEAVDPVLTAAYARLMADPTLGGAVSQLLPGGVAFDFDAQAERVACATLVLTARVIAAPSLLSPSI